MPAGVAKRRTTSRYSPATRRAFATSFAWPPRRFWRAVGQDPELVCLSFRTQISLGFELNHHEVDYLEDDVAKANRTSKKGLPAKYELPSTSGLSKKVEEKSNTIDFDLTD